MMCCGWCWCCPTEDGDHAVATPHVYVLSVVDVWSWRSEKERHSDRGPQVTGVQTHRDEFLGLAAEQQQHQQQQQQQR